MTLILQHVIHDTPLTYKYSTGVLTFDPFADTLAFTYILFHSLHHTRFIRVHTLILHKPVSINRALLDIDYSLHH
jgi:hypothetical protein